MTLFRLVWRSLRQHALSSCVTATGVALAGGLMMAVWSLREQAQIAFTQMTGGVDAVLGARGAKLQLVLNSLFHLDESAGNMPWAEYEAIKKHPQVQAAVPIGVGDSYRGFRVVGTLPSYFTELEPAPGQRYRVRAPGRLFDPLAREAVVGSYVAERLNLKRGDSFRPSHGVLEDGTTHEEDYLVVGILESANTPADRVIWIPLEGIQTMSGHDARAATDVSAVLLRFRSGSTAGFALERQINKEGTKLTLAWPLGRILVQLFDKVAWLDRVLALVAWLVALVASAAILASLHNAMNERRRELGILRTLGARRRTVFALVTAEGAAVAAFGAVGAYFVYGAILTAAGTILRHQVGVVLNTWSWNGVLLWAPAALVLLGALAGAIPAIKAYRLEVAEALAPDS